MDAITEDTRLPPDIDAQPLVQAAAALQPGELAEQSEWVTDGAE